MVYISAVPAYGRDYKSKREVLEDWESGADFLIQDMTYSGYVNKNDKPADVTLNIRYKNLAMVCPVS